MKQDKKLSLKRCIAMLQSVIKNFWTALLNELKFKMSLYDFQQVTDWFIKLLRERQSDFPLKLTNDDIETYKTKLNALL
ncbi:hypothetical protein BHY08_02250 [Vagococcus teuberi]|uniref:Uncharacterized protein n=1 Tax=Vagococcus teuberi TaxID=519472 RepID=A0A1J0A489_9ENTE|nr:hypothetical protein BHY08_02250 [Vagococcus teuberi]RHH69096.1 hypothetical protein DW196_07235 [Vagococcus sp. AM17-17]